MAEKQFVRSIEEWRKEVNVKKMILLGHSMGGFLGCAYALTYPDRVKHLILADPWGFPKKPDDVGAKYNVPLWVKAIVYAVEPLNPLWALRAAGKIRFAVEMTKHVCTNLYDRRSLGTMGCRKNTPRYNEEIQFSSERRLSDTTVHPPM